jgi:branched-chain amino acid transport system permease protein
MENVIQLLISGILVGFSYAVLASGLALIFGVMKIINFAHASFAVLAMYFPHSGSSSGGIDPLFAADRPADVLVFGYVTQRLLIERVIGGSESETQTLIMTMGFSLLIEISFSSVVGRPALSINPIPWKHGASARS